MTYTSTAGGISRRFARTALSLTTKRVAKEAYESWMGEGKLTNRRRKPPFSFGGSSAAILLPTNRISRRDSHR